VIALAVLLAIAGASGSTRAGTSAGPRLPSYGSVRFLGQSSAPGSVSVTGAMAVADFNGDGVG
jgi:hypothetical protein